MLFPKNIEQKIGFDTIRDLISKNCLSELGRKYVEKINFSTDSKLINKLLDQTAEMLKILAADENFPSQNYLDVTKNLAHAAIEGALLDEESFRDIRASLQTVNQCILFINKKDTNEFPQLNELASQVSVDINLLKNINKIIDENGKVRDGASKDLFDIRSELYSEQNALRKRLDSTLKNYQAEEMAADDMSITVRNGRLVIPVFSEFKRKIKGLIHDESATGQMVFIEPIEIFEANNRIKELEIEEKREVNRILISLTNEIRLQLPELQKAYKFLGLIDFIRAKSLLGIVLNATKQFVDNQTIINWNNTFHPLLYIANKGMGKSIIPLSIFLEKNKNVLVISGPNAGGKSVVLKTIALIQYMHQCGLLIPNGEQCKLGIFKDIFIDIGDEQSIDNDLSTYSSHLSNMKEILNSASQNSLVLIDEFGTGTDPQFGGPIAEAILDELVKKKVFAVVNTHYSNLKFFAQNTMGVSNGAMKFDAINMSPLYELEIGKPGNSFAIEIAEKIGLPKHVINSAKSRIGDKKLNVDKLIKELQQEKNDYLLKKSELDKTQKNLNLAVKQYEELKSFIENSKAEQLKKAKTEANKIVQEAKIELSVLLQKLKENKKIEEVEVENTRIKIRNLDKATQVSKSDELNQEVFPKMYSPKIGDRVYVKGQEGIFKIISINGKNAELAIGDLKTSVKTDRLSLAEADNGKNKVVQTKVKGINISDRMMSFNSTLDIRGKRGEEAIYLLDYYLDDAILVSAQEVRILHGKGDGILRKLVREHLKRLPFIDKFSDEKVEFGGDGITIVALK